MKFDREIYFDKVRASLFQGNLDQGQVDGQEAILSVWEIYRQNYDLRWLAYMLATTKHETASEMLPIEEYGKGSGAEYGEIDPETGQAYYGRGFIQLTWRDNYRRGDQELQEKFNIAAGMEAKASNALIPKNAAAVMFLGMEEGWFRSDSGGRQTLVRYFSDTEDDAYLAREIINGDKKTVPSWSNGVSIGNLIKGYHEQFLEALKAAAKESPAPTPTPPDPDVAFEFVDLAITASPGAVVSVTLNGKVILSAKG